MLTMTDAFYHWLNSSTYKNIDRGNNIYANKHTQLSRTNYNEWPAASTAWYGEFTANISGESYSGGSGRNYSSPKVYEEKDVLVVHALAVASLSISTMFSVGTLVYLFRHSSERVFWKKRVSERLTVYLACCDLLHNLNHMNDHSIALATGSLPVGVPCKVFGFILGTGIMVQTAIVTLTAFSAFRLMVFERPVQFGRYDWIFLLASLGIPIAMGTVMASLNLYGPSEVWCMANKLDQHGRIADLLYATVLIICFTLCVIFYGGIFCKIRNTARALEGFTKRHGYEETSMTSQRPNNARAAKIMSLFVLAFITQWTSFVIYTCWSWVHIPPIPLLCIAVILLNAGGIFNFFAYTFSRRQSLRNHQQRQIPLQTVATVFRTSDGKKS